MISLLPAIFAGTLYLNSLENQFTNWDDGMIYQNPTIRSLNWTGIKKIFTPERANNYQPIRILSYAIDYQVWRFAPWGYRITNILWYMLTCVTLFLTLHSLSRHLRSGASEGSHVQVAAFGSLLFAAHPVHVEAVTWLAARKEVLQGFFFFSAFYIYLKGREATRKRIIYFTLSLFLMLLAVLSKPTAVVFPIVILLYEFVQGREKWVKFVTRYWPYFAFSLFISVVFAFLLVRGMVDAGGVKPYRGGNLLNNVLISFYAFIYSIKLLILTVNYSAAYTLPVSDPVLSLRTLGFVIASLVLLGLSAWSLKKSKVLFFCFFFFLITVMPYLNIVPISTLLADRYVFIASLSYCFIMGMACDKLYRARHKRFSAGFFKLLSVSILLLLLAGYSYMTIRQNTVWENSYTLWADAVEKYPDSNTANALLGVVYMDIGMDQDAVKYLEKAVEVLPYDYQSRNNLGIVYGRLGEPEKALRELAMAISLRPDDDKIKINLAVLYQKEKAYQKAEEVLRYLLAKNDHNANLHFRLGTIYKEMGQYDKAIAELRTSSEMAPHIVNPYEELGNLYLNRLGDPEKAKYYYAKGIESVAKTTPKVEEMRRQVQDLER
jgi:tetratricopeptide (TPR) repeat protein